MTRFHVAALVHYTTERPEAWTAAEEAEFVKANTKVGTDPLEDVEVTYLEADESEGGEG